MLKRPLPVILAFFIGGIVSGYTAEIPRLSILAVLGGGLLLSLALFAVRLHTAAFLSLGLCFFSLGIHGISATLYDAPAPDHVVHWANRGRMTLEGVVSENPRVTED